MPNHMTRERSLKKKAALSFHLGGNKTNRTRKSGMSANAAESSKHAVTVDEKGMAKKVEVKEDLIFLNHLNFWMLLH